MGVPPWFGADAHGELGYWFCLVASRYVRIRARMASLRLEYFCVSRVSKSCISWRGALNSTSSMSCLFLLFFGVCFVPLSCLCWFFPTGKKRVVTVSLPYLKSDEESF